MFRSLPLLTASFLFLALNANAQYLETFSTANKGYLASPGCTSDFSGVNWTLTSWYPEALFQAMH